VHLERRVRPEETERLRLDEQLLRVRH
jgi:hypothetical protein